jgi:hypothetical protein
MVGVCLKTRVSPRNCQSSQLCLITRGGDQEGDSMTPVATSESRYTPGIYTLLYGTHYEVYPKTYPITYPTTYPKYQGPCGNPLGSNTPSHLTNRPLVKQLVQKATNSLAFLFLSGRTHGDHGVSLY